MDSLKTPYKRRYGRIYNFARAYNNIGLTETAVLSYLSCRAGKKMMCWPSQQRIADDLGIKCKKTVTRAISRLRASGAIQTEYKMINGHKCFTYLIKCDEEKPRSACAMQYGYIYDDQIQQQSGLSSGAKGLLGHILSLMGRKTEILTRRAVLCEELKITSVTLRKYMNELSSSILSFETQKMDGKYYVRIFLGEQGDKKVPKRNVPSNNRNTFQVLPSLFLNNSRLDTKQKTNVSPLQDRIDYWKIDSSIYDPQKVLVKQTDKEKQLMDMYGHANDYTDLSDQLCKQMSFQLDRKEISIMVAYDMYRFMSRYKKIPAMWICDAELVRSLVNALFGAQVKNQDDRETLKALEYVLRDSSGLHVLAKLQEEIFTLKKKTALIFTNLTGKIQKGIAGKQIRNKIGYVKTCITNFFTESKEWKVLNWEDSTLHEPVKALLPETFEAFLDEPRMMMHKDAICSLSLKEYQRRKLAYEAVPEKTESTIYMDVEKEWIWCVLPSAFADLLNVLSVDDRRYLCALPKSRYSARREAYEKLPDEKKCEAIWGDQCWIINAGEEEYLFEPA